MAELNPDRVRILIVDDDPLVRAGLHMLMTGDDVEVVGQATDGEEAIGLVGHLSPDVVLMDIRMGGVDGLSATEAIGELPDPPKVVVLTTFDTDENVLRALRAGAAGFLLKDTPPSDLVEAVKRVASGDAQLAPPVLDRVIAHAVGGSPDRQAAKERLSCLTDREMEVAQAVGEGLSNAEIAARLFLSVPTVKGYVSAILEKLDAANRVQVALLVREAGTDTGPNQSQP